MFNSGKDYYHPSLNNIMYNRLVDKLKLYNTLTRTKENFIPFKNNIVKMFVCGPTVYDSVHLGHARTYLIYDVLARYLKFKGFKTLFIVNITDLDDKIFEKANNEQISHKTLDRKSTRLNSSHGYISYAL